MAAHWQPRISACITSSHTSQMLMLCLCLDCLKQRELIWPTQEEIGKNIPSMFERNINTIHDTSTHRACGQRSRKQTCTAKFTQMCCLGSEILWHIRDTLCQ